MLKYSCPHCKRVLEIPEKYLGQSGTCNHCHGHFTVEANHWNLQPPDKKTKVVMEFPIYPYRVRVLETKTGWFSSESHYEFSEGSSDKTYSAPFEWRKPPTVEQARDFLSFFLGQPAAEFIFGKKRWHALNSACGAWLDLHGPVAKDGRLKESMVCIGFNQGNNRCRRNTRSLDGLCPAHEKPGSSTIWNADWWHPRDK